MDRGVLGGIEGVEPEATRSRRKRRASWAWKYMPAIPELRRLKQGDYYYSKFQPPSQKT